MKLKVLMELPYQYPDLTLAYMTERIDEVLYAYRNGYLIVTAVWK